jgi:hypothetical protein
VSFGYCFTLISSSTTFHGALYEVRSEAQETSASSSGYQLVSAVTELPQRPSETLSSNASPAIDSAALAWVCRATPEFTGKSTDPVVLEIKKLPPLLYPHRHRRILRAAGHMNQVMIMGLKICPLCSLGFEPEIFRSLAQRPQ